MSTEISVVKSCRCRCDDCGRHAPEALTVNGARREAKQDHWRRVRVPDITHDGKWVMNDLCAKCSIGLEP